MWPCETDTGAAVPPTWRRMLPRLDMQRDQVNQVSFIFTAFSNATIDHPAATATCTNSGHHTCFSIFGFTTRFGPSRAACPASKDADIFSRACHTVPEIVQPMNLILESSGASGSTPGLIAEKNGLYESPLVRLITIMAYACDIQSCPSAMVANTGTAGIDMQSYRKYRVLQNKRWRYSTLWSQIPELILI